MSGICLTVTKFNKESFEIEFGISPETIKLTNINTLQKGSKVNLERAAKTTSRNSGHYVQGHIDCIGTIISKTKDNDSLYIKVEISKNGMEADTYYNIVNSIVKKGFIAIDGTSLTVCSVSNLKFEKFIFEFMLVQYTQNHIIIPQKQLGETVNIEVDVMGKYVSANLQAFNEKLKNYDSLVQTVKTLEDTVKDLVGKVSSLEAQLK